MRVWIPDPPKGYEYLKKIVFDIVGYDVERSALRVRVASNRGFDIYRYNSHDSGEDSHDSGEDRYDSGEDRYDNRRAQIRTPVPRDSLIGAEYTIVWSLFRESR